METLEYYNLIKNSMQLKKVYLKSLNCINNGLTDKNRAYKIALTVNRKVETISRNLVEIQLATEVNFGEEDEAFSFEIVYQGVCELREEVEIDETEFEEFAYDQAVPLLLPYARECLSSTLARMNLPVYNIPTIDVLETLKQNTKRELLSE
ncbi:protein-export chaperone SecB [Bacillus velezensis]|uniref:protein-export chaperone SecB n=1 Tax=Bacillus TaxID=1386 RepID=UPI00227ED8CC|nr:MULTISPECIES: protein-export chaperone SecB [Bacillus subtilis group]MCY8103438.1 protein-export chaperone SecB [Bacillus mojavensis]MCY8481395.1 protein-export chaperone SecB [Bacillus mojavensis]MDN4139883.1 protein-export chaperone SecB [Bacillus velezensis]MEC1135112.1 protein-export chaperone SecB [Bacillus velezensis]